MYACQTCGGAILTSATSGPTGYINEFFAPLASVVDALPERAKHHLKEALESLHSPSACTVSAASAIDAMLKAKGHKKDSLNSRIKQAAANHLITEGMAEWAHEVSLGANEERHADEDAPIPTSEEAKRLLNFARALGDLLFVFPARVDRERKQGKM